MEKKNFILQSGLFALGAISFAQAALGLDLSVNQARVVRLDRPAATVFVAEPKIATYQIISPTKLLVFGRAPGETSFMALDKSGNEIYSTKLDVSYGTEQVKAALKREFPSLNIKLTPVSDGIVVSGKVPSAQTAADVVALVQAFFASKSPSSAPSGSSTSESSSGTDEAGSLPEMPDEDLSGPGLGKGVLGAHVGKVINRLTVTMPNQVVIRVRFAEVTRDVSEKLGINWFWNKTTTGHYSFSFGLADNAVTSSTPGPVTALSSLTDAANVVIPDFSALIEAMAGENLVSILAEPNLSVVSGETASFLAGGQFPFPAISANSNFATTNFKDYGVMLDVTPTVLSENRVSLRVRPEVSELSYASGTQIGNTRVPAIITRRADTTIELADGQSFVIGGLLQNKLDNNVNRIPILGDVPILGALFRSSAYERGESELVIIATAYIGEPSGNNLRIPNANIVIPNVFNRLFLGEMPTVKAGALKPQDLSFY